MPKRAHTRQLTPKQAVFVREYLSHGEGAKAAVAAGYSRRHAKSTAYKLLRECKPVREAVEKVRDEVLAAAEYNLEVAMREADQSIAFAEKTGNANARVKAVELKAKLNGLLIEKHSHTFGDVDLKAALTEARERYAKLTGPVVDAEFTEVASSGAATSEDKSAPPDVFE